MLKSIILRHVWVLTMKMPRAPPPSGFPSCTVPLSKSPFHVTSGAQAISTHSHTRGVGGAQEVRQMLQHRIVHHHSQS